MDLLILNWNVPHFNFSLLLVLLQWLQRISLYLFPHVNSSDRELSSLFNFLLPFLCFLLPPRHCQVFIYPSYVIVLELLSPIFLFSSGCQCSSDNIRPISKFLFWVISLDINYITWSIILVYWDAFETWFCYIICFICLIHKCGKSVDFLWLPPSYW